MSLTLVRYFLASNCALILFAFAGCHTQAPGFQSHEQGVRGRGQSLHPNNSPGRPWTEQSIQRPLSPLCPCLLSRLPAPRSRPGYVFGLASLGAATTRQRNKRQAAKEDEFLDFFLGRSSWRINPLEKQLTFSQYVLSQSSGLIITKNNPGKCFRMDYLPLMMYIAL